MLEDLKLRSGYDGLIYLAESLRNPPRLMTHHHVELELNVVVQGAITYVVEGKRYTFHPRTLLWLFPDQEHQQVDRSDDAQYFVVVFKPALIARSCKTEAYAGLKRTRHEHAGVLTTLLKPDSFHLVRGILDSLMQEALDADLLNREAGFGAKSGFSFEHGDPDGLNAGLHHLLLLCWRLQCTGDAPGHGIALHPSVDRAINMLSSGEWPDDLARLAKTCGVSQSHLSRLFHQQIGVSLSRYRNSLRLSRFWEIYKGTTQKNLTEAMYAAGFGSYAQFYKVFVQAYGRGPRLSLKERPASKRQYGGVVPAKSDHFNS